MTISQSGQYNEVDDSNYVAGTVSVTNTQVQAKVGASNLSGRQTIMLYNTSSATVYYGPSGVTTTTGIPIFPSQFAQLSLGQSINLYLIAAAAGPYSVIVHEVA